MVLIAMSVHAERTFSDGRLLLPHVRNGLSAKSTRAVLCVRQWIKLDLVRDNDLQKAARLPDLPEPNQDDNEYSLTQEDDSEIPDDILSLSDDSDSDE